MLLFYTAFLKARLKKRLNQGIQTFFIIFAFFKK